MKRNDFGSIRQLKSGRWQVRYRDAHGIQRTAKTPANKPLTFITKTAARMYLVNLESDMQRGKTTGNTSTGSELLRDRVEQYINGARLTKGKLRITTSGLYRGLAQSYINQTVDGICLGDLPIKSITRADVRRWHFAHESKCKTGDLGMSNKQYRFSIRDLQQNMKGQKWLKDGGMNAMKSALANLENKCWLDFDGDHHIIACNDLRKHHRGRFRATPMSLAST